MTKLKSLLLLPIGYCLLAILQTGCTSTGKISPSVVKQGVATGVAYSSAKYPSAVPYIRAAAPLICSAANGTNLNPAEVIAAIEASGAASLLKTPEGVLILNGALILYVGIWQSYGEDAVANQPQLKLYLQATCEGINEGLPTSVVRSAPAPSTWPLIKF